MTRSGRMSLRRELFSGGQLCCWCGKEMFLQPDETACLATLEHHFEKDWIVLSHHQCNRSRLNG